MVVRRESHRSQVWKRKQDIQKQLKQVGQEVTRMSCNDKSDGA